VTPRCWAGRPRWSKTGSLIQPKSWCSRSPK
jgi:hypothetical protein